VATIIPASTVAANHSQPVPFFRPIMFGLLIRINDGFPD